MLGKNSPKNQFDLPLGLSMAVSQNPLALDVFTSLTAKEKESLIGEANDRKTDSDVNKGFHIYD